MPEVSFPLSVFVEVSQSPVDVPVSSTSPVVRSSVRPACVSMAVARRSEIMPLRAHELKWLSRCVATKFPVVLDAAP